MLNKQQVLNTCKEIPMSNLVKGDYTIHRGVVAIVLSVYRRHDYYGERHYTIGMEGEGVNVLAETGMQKAGVKAYRTPARWDEINRSAVKPEHLK